MIRFSHHRTVAQSLREYGRGICGGLMFALPLLYTMEVWNAGFLLSPARILAYAACGFVLLLFYNRFAGLRCDASWIEVAIDSVEEMGLGVILSATVLWITGRISAETGMQEMVGKIMVEAMTVAIGVSVGTAQLGIPDEENDGGLDDDDAVNSQRFFSQMALALCGAFLFSANIAPTEEIIIIAAESSAWKIGIIALVSLGIGAIILRFSEFRNTSRDRSDESWHLTLKSVVCSYAVSLGASWSSLWFFAQSDGEPPAHILAMTVVLAFPANLGACAGRLLLQSGTSGPASHHDSKN